MSKTQNIAFYGVYNLLYVPKIQLHADQVIMACSYN